MTYEADRDINTMLALLQQHSHLGADNDAATLDSGFLTRQYRYWGNLKQLRKDVENLSEHVKNLEAELVTVNKEKNDALAQAYKAGVERDNASYALKQLKAEIAKEEARKEAQARAAWESEKAQYRAAAEAAAAAKAKAEDQRRKDLEYIEEAHTRAEKQRADREEAKAKAEADKSRPETEEDKLKREVEEKRWAYMTNRHNGN
jgi:chromosome segregation ATPase